MMNKTIRSLVVVTGLFFLPSYLYTILKTILANFCYRAGWLNINQRRDNNMKEDASIINTIPFKKD